MAEMPKNKGTQGQGRPALGGVPETSPKIDEPPTLFEQGIDKNLAKRARKAASMDEATFEGLKGEKAFSFAYQAGALH